ncbi:hypothetical protein OS493_033453 [Desmophyllum pertusum]|uniref:Uncharacterized protein n=1 Tax=Desmophyllum pertusum TaxID=174260 RepID=A0A9X0D8T6_9CNID|nr:hypothetical protein OS493_033453 [Desmophyllum pertusum]
MLASTKRGFGSCGGCGQSYSTRWKLVTCSNCGGHIGGNREEGPKKLKRSCPIVVLVLETGNEKIFSLRLVLADLATLSASTLKALKTQFVPQRALHLTHADIECYNGDSSSKEMLRQVLDSNPGLVNAFQSQQEQRDVSKYEKRFWKLRWMRTELFYAMENGEMFKLCGGHIGGNCKEGPKRPKQSCPIAVLVLETGNKKIFSVQTSTRDDRCFVVIRTVIRTVLLFMPATSRLANLATLNESMLKALKTQLYRKEPCI